MVVAAGSAPPKEGILDVARRANDALRGDVLRDAVERVQQLAARSDVSYRGQPVTNLLRPALYPAPVVDEAIRRGSAVARVLRGIADNIGRTPDLAARVGHPEQLRFLIDLDGSTPSGRVAARLDGLLDERGEYRVLEYNALMPGGMYECDVLRASFLESRLLRESIAIARISRSCVDEVTDALFRSFGRPARLALVTSKPLPPREERVAVMYLFDALRDQGTIIEEGLPGDLLCTDDGVTMHGRPVDIILAGEEQVLPMILFRLGSDPARLTGHLRSGAVRFLNGLGPGTILGSKGLLAVISEASDEALLAGVGRDDLALARQAVPWTRRLVAERTTLPSGSGDLIEHVLQNRQDLVLKPMYGRGGADVLLGWNTSDEVWQSEVSARLRAGRHVVQQRVASIELPWPALGSLGDVVVDDVACTTDLWVWMDEVATLGYARTLVAGLGNQARGSMATTIFGV